jgi:hypothetical protein
MWLGVLLGLLGLGAGFFGLRRASITEGRIGEQERQKRYAEMLIRQFGTKDKSIDKQTEKATVLVRRTTRLRRKNKNAKSASSFLSRTRTPW